MGGVSVPPYPRRSAPRASRTGYFGSRADAARWVRDALRTQIMEGVFGGLSAPAPMLPSEAALATEYAVSRNAIREALDLLRKEGLVERVPGMGTVVTGAKLRQRLDRLEGLAESLGGHRLPVDNKVLAVRPAPAPAFVATKLAIPEESPVVFVERLRSVGGIPLSLDTSYLRIDALAMVTEADLETNDIFDVIERAVGTRLGWAEVTMEAVPADQATAGLLALRPGAPVLLLHRLTHLGDGTPFDLEAIRYRADRFCLTTKLRRAEEDADAI